MWCPSCKAEVAAEVAADNRRVRCATCGSEIPVPTSFAGHAKTREARELLDRWASERQVDAPPARSPLTAGRGASRSLGAGGVNLESESAFASVRSEDAGPRLRSEVPQHESQASSRRFDSAQSLTGPSSGETSRGESV